MLPHVIQIKVNTEAKLALYLECVKDTRIDKLG